MDAAQALAELTEISTQVEVAAIAGDDGATLAATAGDGAALVDAGRSLLAEAKRLRGGEPTQVEVSTEEGSVFVLRDGMRTIVATTAPEPTVGLVFYDLKTCLRSLDAPAKKTPRKRAPRKKKEKENGDA